MIEENAIYTLAEAVDEYLIQRGLNKKKYFPMYLVCAKWAWKYLFKNTIYAVNSQWFTLKKGTPYNYIDVPRGTVRLFSVATTDECNKIVPLYYDERINIVARPTASQKKCSCDACDCGGLCEDANSMTYTTKVLFTILGVDYIEKIWTKVCPNGDIIEYRTVPVKKYNSFAGDPGDYMNDYMNDFDIGHPPFSDYSIVYENFQKVICKLDVKPCGCPEETPENAEILSSFCGIFLPFHANCKRKHCDDFLGVINSNHKGHVKISECGTKIYYIPSTHHGNKQPALPEFLLVNWQTSGENCTEVVQVPEGAVETLFAGIDFNSKQYNNAYSINEKDHAKYNWRDKQNELLLFFNQISMEWLSTVQDAEIKY